MFTQTKMPLIFVFEIQKSKASFGTRPPHTQSLNGYASDLVYLFFYKNNSDYLKKAQKYGQITG